MCWSVLSCFKTISCSWQYAELSCVKVKLFMHHYISVEEISHSKRTILGITRERIIYCKKTKTSVCQIALANVKAHESKLQVKMKQQMYNAGNNLVSTKQQDAIFSLLQKYKLNFAIKQIRGHTQWLKCNSGCNYIFWKPGFLTRRAWWINILHTYFMYGIGGEKARRTPNSC